jgi:hypothetical protein
MGEDKGHQHTARRFSGVLAHDGSGYGVVSTDADAKDEAQADEPPDVGSKGAGDGADRQN